MDIQKLGQVLEIVEKLNVSIKDNKTPYQFAEDLLEIFPQYTVSKTGYRAIKGKWDETFDNAHWSHSIKGCMAGYKSIYGSHKGIRIYKAQIEGFDVFKFWNDLSQIPFFKRHLNFSYVNEEEILILKLKSEVSEFIDSGEWEESA